MRTKGFFNYFSAIIEFLKVVFKGEIIKFSKNCGIFQLRKVEGCDSCHSRYAESTKFIS